MLEEKSDGKNGKLINMEFSNWVLSDKPVNSEIFTVQFKIDGTPGGKLTGNVTSLSQEIALGNDCSAVTTSDLEPNYLFENWTNSLGQIVSTERTLVVTNVINDLSFTSNYSTSEPLNIAPIVTGFKMTGTPKVGETLGVDYTFTDANGDVEGNTIIVWATKK